MTLINEQSFRLNMTAAESIAQESKTFERC